LITVSVVVKHDTPNMTQRIPINWVFFDNL